MKYKTKLEIEEMEVCANCGRPTDIPKEKPIEFRKTYVEGAGQLCAECYNMIFNKENK